jgi:hypothetical protein
MKALRQTFGVIEPVDAQQQPTPRVFFAHLDKRVVPFLPTGEPIELINVDADRMRSVR